MYPQIPCDPVAKHTLQTTDLKDSYLSRYVEYRHLSFHELSGQKTFALHYSMINLPFDGMHPMWFVSCQRQYTNHKKDNRPQRVTIHKTSTEIFIDVKSIGFHFPTFSSCAGLQHNITYDQKLQAEIVPVIPNLETGK